jgi:hypothetical protein
MSKLSQSEIEQIRGKAQALKTRLDSDPTFKQQLEADPEAVLRAEGFPEAAMGDLLVEFSKQDSDVSGYCAFSCAVTCSVTCYISIASA